MGEDYKIIEGLVNLLQIGDIVIYKKYLSNILNLVLYTYE